MPGKRGIRKTKQDKLAKFGLNNLLVERTVYAAPRPTRHLPGECRIGCLCGERAHPERLRLARRRLLVRRTTPLSSEQTIVAERLPSVSIPEGNPAEVFADISLEMPFGENEHLTAFSAVRRVRIEDTGVIAWERTGYTQTDNQIPTVTLFWGVWNAGTRELQIACIRARGDAALRTHRTRVAGFLRRWALSGTNTFTSLASML